MILCHFAEHFLFYDFPLQIANSKAARLNIFGHAAFLVIMALLFG